MAVGGGTRFAKKVKHPALYTKKRSILNASPCIKKHDVNRDKWIGVGGHFEDGESPEVCMLREVKEETGFTLTAWRFHGVVTFVQEDLCEYMFSPAFLV